MEKVMVRANGVPIFMNDNKYSNHNTVRRRLDRPPLSPAIVRRRFWLTMVCLSFAMFMLLLALTSHRGHAHNKIATPEYRNLNAAQLNHLDTSITALINDQPNDSISVYATDINTGQTVHYGYDGAYTAASTAKIISACDFLHHTEVGDQSLQENLTGSSAENLLEKMVVNSDDDAWQAINDTLTHADLLAYAQHIGLQDYNPDDNTLMPADIQNLLVQLYKGKLLNPADTHLLLGYMRRANYRDYIVPAVPSGTVVYHKAGVVRDEIHDTAIIKAGTHVLVLTIFTSGNGAYDTAVRTQLIQNLARQLIVTFLG